MTAQRTTTQRRSRAKPTAEAWNAKHAIGTPVRYFPILPPTESAPPVETRTRSQAWTLGDKSAVVLIEGRSGGVWLAHLEVSTPDSLEGKGARDGNRDD